MGHEDPYYNLARLLVSFPKSGNTWVRLLLAHYLADEALDINTIAERQFMTMDDAKWVWDMMGIPHLEEDPHALDTQTLMKLRHIIMPHIVRLYNEDNTFPGIKVHCANAWVESEAFPYINWPFVHSAVYLVRNPLDVAPSLKTHMSLETWERTINSMTEEGFSIKKADSNIVNHVGGWNYHFDHWTRGHPWVDRVLVVRYEDLKRDTVGWFKHILNHFDIQPVDEERIKRAVANCSMAKLQEQEAEGGFKERPDTSDKPFFGFKHEALPDWAREELTDKLRKDMEANGYI